MELNTPVVELPGVGPGRARALERLGLRTAGDLLRHFPRQYEDRSRRCTVAEAGEDGPVCVEALVTQAPRLAHVRRGLDLVKARAADGTGVMDLTFFNQSYVKDALRLGESYVFYGRVEGRGRTRRMVNPVFEPEARQRFTGRIMPVYALTAGISNNLLAGLVRRVLDGTPERVEDPLPEQVRSAHGLLPAREALEQIHFPRSFEQMEAARRRMVFEELFCLSAGLELLRSRRSGERGVRFEAAAPAEFLRLLPFAPTNAQRRAMEELEGDMASGRPMNRLLQGDVGSGKTAVAAFGAWAAWKNGRQSALMAPTEILAEQHWRTLSGLLSPAGMRVGLLTGGMRQAEKQAALAALAAGELDLVVGTHALLTERVSFHSLGLVVADEQHRFGVNQRAALAAKGGETRPHVLVMSATPIPRTLALIIYGDLDVSVLDELPPGRTPVSTLLIGEDKRTRMYGFVRRLVGQGRQVYMVCPAVEESEGEDPGLKAAAVWAAHLQRDVFPELRVGLVHGRLRPAEKDRVMSDFAAGKLDILVSTTVIEVGVDVPNAALMVVENAERFGLSQLHQLRGRVGRGKWQSWCVLVTAGRDRESLTRLKVLTATADGFRIAEEDLKLRGPGDFFGARQHGLPRLKVADFATDMALLRQAQDAARALIASDPGLDLPEHRLLLSRVRQLFSENPDIFN